MGWFGPSKLEVLRQLSQEIGAEFVDGGYWKENKVQGVSNPGRLRSTSYASPCAQNQHIYYTRIRAPYINPENFRFTIYRKGIFSELGKLLGMQDIEVGDPEFDESFIIKGNDETTVVRLFANSKIREMIHAQPKIRLEVKDNDGWFGSKFPADVDELHFRVVGVIKDVERLKALFDLLRRGSWINCVRLGRRRSKIRGSGCDCEVASVLLMV